MNKLTYFALIGVASAQLGRKDEMDFMLPPKEVCDLKDEETLTSLEYFTSLKYESWNAFVKGFYNSKRANPVSKECYGEWMTPKIENIMVFADKLHRGDMFTISKDEFYTVATDGVDLAYDNFAKCGYERHMNNMMDFATDNMDNFMGEGLMARVTEHGAPLMGKAWDLMNLFMADDSCYSDVETINEISKFIEDFSSIFSTLIGFEGKWEQKSEIQHKTQADFKKFKDQEKKFFEAMTPEIPEIPEVPKMPEMRMPEFPEMRAPHVPEMPTFEMPQMPSFEFPQMDMINM